MTMRIVDVDDIVIAVGGIRDRSAAYGIQRQSIHVFNQNVLIACTHHVDGIGTMGLDSNTKGTATMVGFSERARKARTRSFDDAIHQMIGNLQAELKAFRARAPADPNIRLILPPGYDPNAKRSVTQ